MQITIDSSDLLEIFIEAGIGQTDAKALILDILMLQEKPKTPPSLPKREVVSAKQTTSTEHVRIRPVQHPLPSQKVEDPQVNEMVDDYSIDHDEVEEQGERPAVTRVNSKSMSRPNFSSFGGESTGLK